MQKIHLVALFFNDAKRNIYFQLIINAYVKIPEEHIFP